jgi:hypothetical protein
MRALAIAGAIVAALVLVLPVHAASSSSTPPRHATRTLGLTKDSPRPVVCLAAVAALQELSGAPGRDSARVRVSVRALAERACWR